MSGTSLDGIDVAEIHFSLSNGGTWNFEMLASTTTEYSSAWRKKLQKAVLLSNDQIEALDIEYTHYLSEVILDFIKKHQIENLDAICSHGHTVMHQPENGITVQIGNLPILSKLLSQRVVCNFRVQDVLLGGQGAPLVPMGDALLFGEYTYCLNLGGFANISSEIEGKRIAYDICPVNIVLNMYAESLGFSYDDKGSIAASGTLNLELLRKLNDLSFFSETAPKSLGLEWVIKWMLPILDASKISHQDKLRTTVEHIAIQLSAQIETGSKVLVTGGGVYNDFLMSRLQSLGNFELIRPSRKLIDYKEALIFGLLGVLKLRGSINCLGSVTGARNDHSSGNIFLG